VQELREQVERQELLLRKRTLETASNWYDDYVNPAEPLFDTPDFFFPLAGENLPFNLDNRLKGELLPVYITEYGLKILRDFSRWLAAFNPFALNALENRVSYVVGKGFGYRAVPAKGQEASDWRLCRQAQAVLDDFLERTDWGELEQEVMRRADRDGEAFLRFFPTGDGLCTVRTVEPEHVRSPGDQSAHLSFGVETPQHDVQDALAYWVVEEPSLSWTPSRVPADEVVHVRFNVDRTAKRGYPTLIPVRRNLLRADKLLQNMSTLAQVQATFALIRKHKQFSASAVQTWQQGQADLSVSDPVSGNNRFLRRYLPGTILDVPEQTDYEFPAAKVPADSLVAVLQAELRAVAARLVLPEYMLTSNAENANYASTLVAEAPAVKHFERLQRQLARSFGDGRYGGPGRCGAFWRVLECAVRWGKLPREVLRRVSLHVEPPSPVARDKDKETARAAALNKAGVLSKATWSKWEGLDPARESRQLEQEKTEGKPQSERDQVTETTQGLREACRPHKTGRFAGTSIGYDSEKHNTNCRLAGTSTNKVTRKSRKQQRAAKRPATDLAKPALPAALLAEAQRISNQGVPVQKGVTDETGPNVTSWFARDLLAHLKHRFDKGHQGFPPADMPAYKHQAADLMSYKWLDFGSPGAGKGANTVIVGDMAMAKKQLGNIAFMFVPTIDRPNTTMTDIATVLKSGLDWIEGDKYGKTVLDKRGEVKSTLDAISRIGYAISPNYDPPTFGDFDGKVVYRADNLAAFGVGRQLGWEFLDSVVPGDHTQAAEKIEKLLTTGDESEKSRNMAELAGKLEAILRKKFTNDGKQLGPEIDAFRKLQPIPGAPPISVDALTFTPDYGGFNFRSLSGSQNARRFDSTETSIGAASRMFDAFKNETGHTSNDKRFRDWRKKKFESWTEPGNGFRFNPPAK
jgi:capsid protein